MNDKSRIIWGAFVGALVGAAGGYLFFTDRGRALRDRLEPAVDEIRRELARYRRTAEKLGDMASEGMRVINEFNAARMQSQYGSSEGTSH